jgi:hypothetical protein
MLGWLGWQYQRNVWALKWYERRFNVTLNPVAIAKSPLLPNAHGRYIVPTDVSLEPIILSMMYPVDFVKSGQKRRDWKN